MLGFILFLLIIGLVAGFIARALVPGDDSMSVVHTIVLGIVGSFVGGMIGYALFRKDGEDGAFQASGLIGSVVGTVLVLVIWNAYKGRSNSRHAHS
jgi:uncharacterized membrane protein YeaQ/YmgE (transglycosylase-associated protein family)